jgi:hypothetical protein
MFELDREAVIRKIPGVKVECALMKFDLVKAA